MISIRQIALAEATRDTVEARAELALREIGIMQNPYFIALENGTMTKADFGRGQRQFYFAVEFYSRPMSMLMARQPQLDARLDLLHNIVDEHGEFDLSRSHPRTFARFLDSLGYALDESVRPLPAVQSFNNVLLSLCAFESVETGMACLGVIELAFADISGFIGSTVVKRGFVEQNNLSHYKLHRDLDRQHARDFFLAIEPRFADPAGRQAILRGLEIGAHIFDRLYSELLK